MENLLPTLRIKFMFGATVVISTIGIFGNLLSFGIFLTKKFRGQSMFTYLTVIVIMNIIIMFYLWPLYVFNITSSTTACKILFYTVFAFFKISAFLNSIVSIDHVFAILAPFKLTFRKKISFQIGVIIAVFVLVFAIDVPYALYADLVPYANISSCTLVTTIQIRAAVNVTTTVLSTIVPFIIMIVCSIIIAIHFFRSKSSIKKSKLSQSRESRLTQMFFALNILFIIIHTPFCIINIYSAFYNAGAIPAVVFDLIIGFGYLAYSYKSFSVFHIFIYKYIVQRESSKYIL